MFKSLLAAALLLAGVNSFCDSGYGGIHGIHNHHHHHGLGGIGLGVTPIVPVSPVLGCGTYGPLGPLGSIGPVRPVRPVRPPLGCGPVIRPPICFWYWFDRSDIHTYLLLNHTFINLYLFIHNSIVDMIILSISINLISNII